MHRIISGWNNYWFKKDLTFSAAVLRIFCSISVLLMLIVADYGDFTSLLDKSRQSIYEPIGLLQLMGAKLPSTSLFNVIRIVAFVSTSFLILGLFTRVVKVLSVVSSLLIVSVLFSWGGAWSHGQNIPLLMHIALLFAPSHLHLSVDRWIFKNKPSSWFMKKINNGWGVYLAMFAAVIMFSNAGYYKLVGTPNLGWVFSDNLRNYIIQQYLIIFQEPIPFYIEWMLNNEVIYKGVALGNMVFQLGIVLAIFFIKRPVIRLLFGMVFMIEMLGLYFVMGYENLPWIFLVAAFIDWEWLATKWNWLKALKMEFAKNISVKYYKQIGSTIIIVYLVVFIITAFDRGHGWQNKYKPYPFSDFSMFSTTFAKKPYSKHFPVEFYGNEFVFDTNTKESNYLDSLKGALSYKYYKTNGVQIYDTTYIRQIVRYPEFLIKNNNPQETIHAIEWYKLVNQCPAYPAPIKLKAIYKGLIGKIDANGKFKTFVAEPFNITENKVYLKLQAVGYDNYSVTAVKGILDKSESQSFNFKLDGDTLIVYKVPEEVKCSFLITITDGSGLTDVYLTGKNKL